jgi:hypothetical protein
VEKGITPEMIEEASLRSAANTGSTYNLGQPIDWADIMENTYEIATESHGQIATSYKGECLLGKVTKTYDWSLAKCRYCKSGHVELRYNGKMVFCLDCKAMCKR